MNNELLITPENTQPRELSRLYYFAGLRVSEISKMLGTPESTLYDWRKQDKWDEADFFTKCQDAFQLKYLRLLMKNTKTENEMREFKELGVQMKNIYSPKPERKKRSAQINSDQFDWEKFKNQIKEGYQDLKLYQQSAITDIRKYEKSKRSAGVFNWLKSRQIGFSYGLAYDALLRLVELENNQIYIAASKNQAYTSRNYVFKFVHDLTGLDLKGTDSVEFKKGLRFYFLGANPSTAQSYSGDVTMDEYMWMPRFDELNEVVTACATNERYIIKRMSTPSSKKHASYKLWNADDWNKAHKNNPVRTDYKTLKSGLLCPDGQYRRIITLEDAIKEGCDWINIDRLRLRYPDEETFSRLYECEFFDDVSSAFSFDDLNAC
ncbi:terminase large subunit domain-containing protein, partial [Wohlfahrtiimonas larvae]